MKDLFFRQKKHINHWNSVLYDKSIQLNVIRGKINIDYEPSLYEACSTLCLNTFKRFKIRLEDAKNYVKQVQSINCVCINSLKHPNAPARLCHHKLANHQFTCKTCEFTIAYEEQCVHSIVTNDMLYIKEKFGLRHFRRDYVSSEYKKEEKKIQEKKLKSKQSENNHPDIFEADEEKYNNSQEEIDDYDSNSDFDSIVDVNSDSKEETEADNFLT